MSKSKALWAVNLSVLFLSACAIAEPGYVKEGATEAQQKQDAYECERDASMVNWGSLGDRKLMFQKCMELRGYSNRCRRVAFSVFYTCE